jgi:probable biosynthetic protein (TIGR04098 family)
VDRPGENAAADLVEAALRAELPEFAASESGRSWLDLGLDSFGLLALRLSVEQGLGREIADADWIKAATPRDVVRLASAPGEVGPSGGRPPISLSETIEVGMPQMAQSGLSENWLMKTLGDLHWRLVGQAHGTRPSRLRDDSGARLVPVFTRIRFVSSGPLAAFREGETLAFTASLSGLGAGLFFSTVTVQGEQGRAISAELMSSFVMQSDEPADADLPPSGPSRAAALAEMPRFGLDYQERRRRSSEPAPVLERAGYEILPQYDINGVGMLYCAAYPIIADICQMRGRGGALWAAETSTFERDIFYFANAGLDARLEWRLHRDEEGDGLSTEASIARDDGRIIAWLATRKQAL